MMEFFNGKDDTPYSMKKHVPNHQPVILFSPYFQVLLPWLQWILYPKKMRLYETDKPTYFCSCTSILVSSRTMLPIISKYCRHFTTFHQDTGKQTVKKKVNKDVSESSSPYFTIFVSQSYLKTHITNQFLPTLPLSVFRNVDDPPSGDTGQLAIGYLSHTHLAFWQTRDGTKPRLAYSKII